MNLLVPKVCISVLVLSGFSADAQRHETFAERPSKRQEKVQAAHERARREKEEARQWAQARGLPMRRDDGRRVKELMAIRDGRPIYYTTENDDAAISTAANLVRNTAPFSVDGSEITVGVWDAGSVLETHREFGSRVTDRDGISSHYHATHVGGTIGASGIDARAEGMAPAVDIDSYDWGDDISEMTAAAASSVGEAGKIYLSNHSYGTVSGWRRDSDSGSEGWHFFGDWSLGAEPFFGQYNASARAWDDIVYNAPYFLPFKSAGNDRDEGPSNGDTVYYKDGGWKSTTYTNTVHPKGDGVYKNGYDTIPTTGNAKNIMTVGAVYDAVSGSSRYLPNAGITAFSSWGPSDDGRIKPDIVANGYDLYSCDDDNNSYYATNSGTSMSSPNACGSAALLVDYYNDLFPGQAMRASTLKGLIIHTADDLGNPGPDYSYGWGLMNTLAAAELLRDYSSHPIRLTEAALTIANLTDEYAFFSDGNEPIRVTLCWTDPPGASISTHDSRSPRLVNDLDLRIVGPGGTYWPYRLDYNNPSGNATASSENNIDNVEQVYIDAPAAGQYTVMVDYDGILSGNMQWYSLLISGPGSDTDADGMPDHWEMTYFQSPIGAVATADADGDGADNLTEYITGHDPTNSASVFRVESFTAPATGNAPFIINWPTVAGRRYSVGYAYDLVSTGLVAIPGAMNLPHTQNSYTDTVERVGNSHFYRVDVRLDP